MIDESEVAQATARYPPPDITPAKYEEFVRDLFSSIKEFVEDLEVRLHEKIQGVDGTYDFDATVRFTFAGMRFLVLVEAKRHQNPIKRELVQVLHGKLQSVGAQKAVMFSTAAYQRGALDFAKTHGIALATLTEGRFLYETRSVASSPVLSPEDAEKHFGLPTFAAHVYRPGDSPGSTRVTTLDPAVPEYVLEDLLGVDARPE